MQEPSKLCVLGCEPSSYKTEQSKMPWALENLTDKPIYNYTTVYFNDLCYSLMFFQS